MAVNEQAQGHGTIDVDGLHTETGIWVPANAVLGFRHLYGVDDQADTGATPTRFAALAVAPHAALTRAQGDTHIASGTAAGTYTASMTAPTANQLSMVEGWYFSADIASAVQTAGVTFTGLSAFGQAFRFGLKTTDAAGAVYIFPWPIPATAKGVQVVMSMTISGVANASINWGLWGFNRPV